MEGPAEEFLLVNNRGKIPRLIAVPAMVHPRHGAFHQQPNDLTTETSTHE